VADIIQAGGIVFLDQGGVVRRTAKGEGVFPKGHLEEGESLEEAARREVEEETGLHPRLLFKAGEVDYFLEGHHYRVHLFAMEAEGSTPAWERHKGLDAFLFPAEEAVRKISFPETADLLKMALARRERDRS